MPRDYASMTPGDFGHEPEPAGLTLFPEPDEVGTLDLLDALPEPHAIEQPTPRGDAPLGVAWLLPKPAPKVDDLTPAVCDTCHDHDTTTPATIVYEVRRYHGTEQAGGGHLARYVGACDDDAHRAAARSCAFIYSRGWDRPADEPTEHYPRSTPPGLLF